MPAAKMPEQIIFERTGKNGCTAPGSDSGLRALLQLVVYAPRLVPLRSQNNANHPSRHHFVVCFRVWHMLAPQTGSNIGFH